MPRRDPHDQILASVLFTDIVGSTETAARLGDRGWKQLSTKHNAVMRKELKRFRGKEMDTAGDGFFATFDQPADAIRCAVAVSERLAPLDVHIRAGVHIGQVEVGGPKVQGIAVAIGARVMAKAQGDEVLVSSTVRDALAGADITFEDRGTYELKGVPGEWHLFAVRRSEALVARALGNELVELPGEGDAPARPWHRQTGALVAIAVVVVIAVAAVFALSLRDDTSSFEPAVNTVMALDPSDASVVTGAAVGAVPLAVGADDTSVWVTNSGSGNVTKVDPTGDLDPLTLAVDPPGAPGAVAVGGGTAWVTIDGDTGAAVDQFAANATTPKRTDLAPGVAGIAYGDGIRSDHQQHQRRSLPPRPGDRRHTTAVPPGGRWRARGGRRRRGLRLGRRRPPTPRAAPRRSRDRGGETHRAVGRSARSRRSKGVRSGSRSPIWTRCKRIDASTFQQVTVPQVCDLPQEIAVTEADAWVTCVNSRMVVGIDTQSNVPGPDLTLDQGLVPWGIAVGAGYVWVTVTAP